MKKHFLLLLILTLSLKGFSQKKPKTQDWFFYDLSYINLSGGVNDLNQKWYSNGNDFSFMGEKMFTSNIGIGFGLGFSSYSFHNNMRIQSVEETGIEVYSLQNDDEYESNVQRIGYICIPIELRFRTTENEDNNFWRFYVGAKPGIRTNAHSDFQTDLIHERFYALDDLNRFRVDGYIRIGYGAFGLFASYGLLELYQEGSFSYGENLPFDNLELNTLRPLAIGISVGID